MVTREFGIATWNRLVDAGRRVARRLGPGALVLGIALPGAFVMMSHATARQFPTKPIRMVVPFAPGGISDIFARTVAGQMGRTLGQTVVVDNRPGASGNIGTQLVARSSADGYTLLFVAPAFATNVSLYRQPGYDPVRDFAPVAQVAAATNLLVASPATGVRSVRHLIELAGARPGALNYGSGGAGTSGQLAAELFQSAARIKLTHVPYKGAGPALTALVGNEVQLMFSPVILVLPHVAGGRLNALAVTSGKRSPAVPAVPTIAESAVPGFDVTSWFGVVVPAGVPRDRRQALHDSVAGAMRMPEIAERFTKQGAEPVARSPDEFGAYIRAEVEKWSGVIRSAGLTAN